MKSTAAGRGSRGLALFPTINRDRLPADPACLIRRKKRNAVGDVLRGTRPFEGDAVQQRLLARCAHGGPLALGVFVGSDESGGNAIDGDAPGAQLMA